MTTAALRAPCQDTFHINAKRRSAMCHHLIQRRSYLGIKGCELPLFWESKGLFSVFHFQIINYLQLKSNNRKVPHRARWCKTNPMRWKLRQKYLSNNKLRQRCDKYLCVSVCERWGAAHKRPQDRLVRFENEENNISPSPWGSERLLLRDSVTVVWLPRGQTCLSRRRRRSGLTSGSTVIISRLVENVNARDGKINLKEM